VGRGGDGEGERERGDERAPGCEVVYAYEGVCAWADPPDYGEDCGRAEDA
jgi:hypothetical protein